MQFIHSNTISLINEIDQFKDDIGYPPICVYVNKDMYLEILDYNKEAYSNKAGLMFIQGLFIHGVRVIKKEQKELYRLKS